MLRFLGFSVIIGSFLFLFGVRGGSLGGIQGRDPTWGDGLQAGGLKGFLWEPPPVLYLGPGCWQAGGEGVLLGTSSSSRPVSGFFVVDDCGLILV